MSKPRHIITEKVCAVSDFNELFRVREFVQTEAENFGFSEEDAYKIALAVDEACTNLIKHTYKCANNKQFCVQIEKNSNQFTINISDSGAPFNPMDVNQPDIQEYIQEMKRGGLGIPIIRMVMDEIHYYPSNKSRPENVLKLIKALNQVS